VCADEPADMLYHSHHITGNKVAAPQRESALAPGPDSKKVNKQRSVHFSSDSKAVVCCVMFQHLCTHDSSRQLITCVLPVQKTGFWSMFKYAIAHGKGQSKRTRLCVVLSGDPLASRSPQ